jgi:hypothetical protein
MACTPDRPYNIFSLLFCNHFPKRKIPSDTPRRMAVSTSGCLTSSWMMICTSEASFDGMVEGVRAGRVTFTGGRGAITGPRVSVTMVVVSRSTTSPNALLVLVLERVVVVAKRTRRREFITATDEMYKKAWMKDEMIYGTDSNTIQSSKPLTVLKGTHSCLTPSISSIK